MLRKGYYFHFAEVAELVDAHASGACGAILGGSSPLFGTTLCNNNIYMSDMYFRVLLYFLSGLVPAVVIAIYLRKRKK